MEDSISETMDSYILCNPAIRVYLMDHTIHLPHLEDPESFIKDVYKRQDKFLLQSGIYPIRLRTGTGLPLL